MASDIEQEGSRDEMDRMASGKSLRQREKVRVMGLQGRERAREVAARRIAGPFKTRPFANLICSPLGAVEKKGTNPIKYRRIHHLSWPRGKSVNDFVRDMTVRYARFDDAMEMLRRLGKGARFCKIDVSKAFRVVPVRPDDRHLLGMVFQDLFYVDTCLPFGLMVGLGAKIVPGSALVSAWLDLPARLATADLVITGEGRFDATSLGGKGPGALVTEARRLGKSAHVFAGSLGLPETDGLHAITPPGLPLAEALPRTAELLAAAVRTAL